MENNNYLTSAILAVVALVAGLLVGIHLAVAPQGSSFNCSNGGASVPVSSSPGSTPTKFGAESSSFGDMTVTNLNNSGSATSSAFLAATTLTFGVNAGTAVTSTYTGTTSTLSLPGRACFNLVSVTGTRWAVTFANGVFQTGTLGQCAQ